MNSDSALSNASQTTPAKVIPPSGAPLVEGQQRELPADPRLERRRIEAFRFYAAAALTAILAKDGQKEEDAIRFQIADACKFALMMVEEEQRLFDRPDLLEDGARWIRRMSRDGMTGTPEYWEQLRGKFWRRLYYIDKTINLCFECDLADKDGSDRLFAVLRELLQHPDRYKSDCFSIAIINQKTDQYLLNHQFDECGEITKQIIEEQSKKGILATKLKIEGGIAQKAGRA